MKNFPQFVVIHTVKSFSVVNEAERKKELNEDNLRDLWDNVKCPNIRIIGVPEEEDKKKGYEKIFEEIIVENFPKWGRK